MILDLYPATEQSTILIVVFTVCVIGVNVLVITDHLRVNVLQADTFVGEWLYDTAAVLVVHDQVHFHIKLTAYVLNLLD